MSARRGILLAGGTGSRLWPVTLAVSKQLLPIYDKPMIFYPLTTLMQAGIRDIAVITTPADQPAFQRLMDDGSQWGLRLTWCVQERPVGLPNAYTVAEEFLDGHPSTMVLGDNLFMGHGLSTLLRQAGEQRTGATLFAHQVTDPGRYGVVAMHGGRVVDLVEKPVVPPSSWAVTGLYLLDGTAPQRARALRPSARGETEITDLLRSYLPDCLTLQRLGHGFTWLDTGTHASLLDASNVVRTLSERQGLWLGSPELCAFEQGWVDADGVRRAAARYGDSPYATALNAALGHV